MTDTYNEPRFHKSTIAFLTKYVEQVDPAGADPKVVSEIVKLLLGLDIKSADLSGLPADDPALAQARKLAAEKRTAS